MRRAFRLHRKHKEALPLSRERQVWHDTFEPGELLPGHSLAKRGHMLRRKGVHDEQLKRALLGGKGGSCQMNSRQALARGGLGSSNPQASHPTCRPRCWDDVQGLWLTPMHPLPSPNFPTVQFQDHVCSRASVCASICKGYLDACAQACCTNGTSHP